MPRLTLTLPFQTFLCTCGRALLSQVVRRPSSQIVRVLPLFLGLLLPLGAFAQSSEGTDFWFTFLEHRDPENARVAMISARAATSGTISIPAVGWSQDFTVAANNVVTIDLPTAAETLGSEQVTGSAVHVVSSSVISLFIHQYFGRRSEASLVLPTPALGSDYYVLGYSGRQSNRGEFPSTFAVVATEDDTELVITDLQAATQGNRSVGDDIAVVLNQGEVYQVRAAIGTTDLTGTRVTTSAPVALYSGAAWSGVPGESCPTFDNLLEINYPISQWGTDYLGVTTLRNTSHLYRVIAAENNTSVLVQGNTDQVITLQAGGYADFSRSETVNITADRPVLVAQYLLGSNCNGHPVSGLGDPSFFLLNELTQTLDTVTVFNSRLEEISENFLTIVFRSGDEGSVKLDGNLLTSPIEETPTGDYRYTRVQVADGNHTITSAGCGVIVTVYGYGNAESYAYGGGAAFRNINANPIAEGGCLGDSIQFFTGLDTLRFCHRWTLEDGTVENRADFARFYGELGNFSVSLIIDDKCLGTSDTSLRDIAITLRQAVTASPDDRTCEGNDLALEAFDLPGARYEWTGPNGFEEFTQIITLTNLRPEQAGTYEVVGNVMGCRTIPEEVEVMVDSTPVVRFGGDTTYCRRNEDNPTIDAGAFARYAWSTGQASNPLSVRDEGTYSVTVTDENGCVASASTLVDEFCPTTFYVPSAFSPNADGINDRFKVFAVDFTSVSLAIYDRWGGQVFQSTEAVLEWDGRVDGELVGNGTYLYVAVVDGTGFNGNVLSRTVSGTVVLVR